MSKRFDLEVYVKELGRDKLDVAQLADGLWRVSGHLAKLPNVRFEFDADPRVGHNIVSARTFNEPSKEPTHSQEVVWKRKGDIWYGEQIVEVRNRVNLDGTPGMTTRSIFKYDDFAPNVEVAPAVFTLPATGVPLGARFTDRRKGAPNRLLYWDGEMLKPQKPRM